MKLICKEPTDVTPALKRFGDKINKELEQLGFEIKTEIAYTVENLNKSLNQSVLSYPMLRKFFKGIEFQIDMNFIEKEEGDGEDNDMPVQ